MIETKPFFPHVQVSTTLETAFKLPFGAVREAGLRRRSRPFTLPSTLQGLLTPLSTLPRSGNIGFCLPLKGTDYFISSPVLIRPLVPLLPLGPPLSHRLLSCITSIHTLAPRGLGRRVSPGVWVITRLTTFTTHLPSTLQRTGGHPTQFQGLRPYRQRLRGLWTSRFAIWRP